MDWKFPVGKSLGKLPGLLFFRDICEQCFGCGFAARGFLHLHKEELAMDFETIYFRKL